jgi:2-C-methyl-D-erythritol 4-phosphate cytidylyltransferase
MPAALLAAGGSSRRLAAAEPKQFLSIEGRPVIGWAFDAIKNAGIEEITVVVPTDRVQETWRLLPDAAAVVQGGRTRQESVRLGLERVTQDRVVVHDAARPFAPSELFLSVLAALERADAAVPGLQMQETVKRVRDDRVVETLDREEIWNIQTPQAFHTQRLRDAHARAAGDGFQATDDAQLIEHYEGTVVVVAGSPAAFKLTLPGDLERARDFVKGGPR